MSYFDDLELFNVIKVRMYGAPSDIPMILTGCHYLGMITGKVIISGEIIDRPFIYLTPQNITAAAGWTSPPGAWRDNFYLECGGERADRFFAAFGALEKPVRIPVENPEIFQELFEDIRQYFANGDPLSRSRTAVALETIASRLEEEMLCRNQPRRIHRIIREISLHPEQSFDFASEAAGAGITLRHWNRLFTAAAGMPPHRFVLHCRIRAARRLLTSTSLSIKEICVKCGFEDPAEFSRTFRKHTGMTASGYRKARFL